MEHYDEKILKARCAAAQEKINEAEKEDLEMEQQESIMDACVHIEGKEVCFSRRVIEEMGISIYMPESFEQMDDEMKAAVYPFGNPPQKVYADLGIPFQITLKNTGSAVPDEGIPKFMQISAKVLENFGPKSKILANGVIRHHDHNIGIMEAGTRAMDCNVHNVMFDISIHDQIVMGNIHFAIRYSKRMIPIAKQMIDSIEFLEGNDGNDNISQS